MGAGGMGGGGSNGMGRWGKTSVQTDGYYHKLAHVTENYHSHYDRTVKFQKKFHYFGATYCIAPVVHLFLFRQHFLVEKWFNAVGISITINQLEQT